MRTCGDSHEVAPLFKVSQLRAKPPNTKADLVATSLLEHLAHLIHTLTLVMPFGGRQQTAGLDHQGRAHVEADLLQFSASFFDRRVVFILSGRLFR